MSNLRTRRRIAEEGDSVTWNWQVVNPLPGAVKEVVLSHRISPSIPIKSASGPSGIVGEGVKSRWATLAAGEKAEGQIIVKLPEDLNGSVQISGRLTWTNP